MPPISLFIRSPATLSERRFDTETALVAIRAKLETVTGIPAGEQVWNVYRDVEAAEQGQGGRKIGQEETLQDAGVQEWECIQVTSVNPQANLEGEFTDVSRVDKYEISNEEYEKRHDTVLQDLKARGLGRFAPASSAPPPPTHRALPDQTVGKRCIVLHPGATASTAEPIGDEPRGTIEFVGKTLFGKGKGKVDEGDWIGVRLDEPVGKNDGSVEGERYFESKPNHGVFVRPERIVIGDWPEIDEFADMDDEDEI
ncbi:hypothetical protein NliqN6_1237 [Naganishia liquefaciens]|uniref:CAP-Gly domain-containing protein n=1 Tax=Naganishia liquefaciens TaxID=104408 RepID=A0A8H3YCY9_9TREE|nr:hypothetical protein NliqN6_1237 [Naganishia liquefaciens]